jgi:hypothetical protein
MNNDILVVVCDVCSIIFQVVSVIDKVDSVIVIVNVDIDDCDVFMVDVSNVLNDLYAVVVVIDDVVIVVVGDSAVIVIMFVIVEIFANVFMVLRDCAVMVVIAENFTVVLIEFWDVFFFLNFPETFVLVSNVVDFVLVPIALDVVGNIVVVVSSVVIILLVVI